MHLPDLGLALEECDQSLEAADPGSPAWRWRVRRHLGAVRDALSARTAGSSGWLAARADVSGRQRDTLLGRLHALGPRVLEDADVETVTVDVQRLLADIQRHDQRLHDLAYDEVELELGGSE